MAIGDYILCCKCEVKLIYDGDRGQREWWEERFGKPPEIECPDCKTPPRQPLTDEELFKLWDEDTSCDMPDTFTQFKHTARAIEAKLKQKNT